MKRYSFHQQQFTRRRPDSERWSGEDPLWQRLRGRSGPIEIDLLEDEDDDDGPEEESEER